jgi:hypothetical protein
MSLSGDARQRLAADQARLVAALSGQAAAPAGFDAGRVELAAYTLVAKRRKVLARACPRLVAALGDPFEATFDAFAKECAPHPKGPPADGLAFARWLDRRGELPPVAIPELIAMRLWSGPPIGLALHATARTGLRLGVRLPRLGVRILSPPFFSR